MRFRQKKLKSNSELSNKCSFVHKALSCASSCIVGRASAAAAVHGRSNRSPAMEQQNGEKGRGPRGRDATREKEGEVCTLLKPLKFLAAYRIKKFGLVEWCAFLSYLPSDDSEANFSFPPRTPLRFPFSVETLLICKYVWRNEIDHAQQFFRTIFSRCLPRSAEKQSMYANFFRPPAAALCASLLVHLKWIRCN